MNRHCYRVLFNRARGLFVVCQENARSAGGSPSPAGCVVRFAAVSFIAAACALLCVDLAHGQIIADPSAQGRQRPTVLSAPNGVPVVNIQTPSAAGVSHNSYRQFDVATPGAVLNNSRGNVQTQLGGWVQGNPWLAGGSARVILNEVNSSNPSLLRGAVEVAGPRAEVIIANPSGITVDGGSFINTSRVTLTTGTPVMIGGSLESYRVQRGSVLFEGRGLDASATDYTAILARAVQVNAGIWAKDLKVVAGAHEATACAASMAKAACWATAAGSGATTWPGRWLRVTRSIWRSTVARSAGRQRHFWPAPGWPVVRWAFGAGPPPCVMTSSSVGLFTNRRPSRRHGRQWGST